MQDIVNEDRICELPEDLLTQILSLLTTEIVVATRVLSKRWGSLWKLVPTIEFDYYNCYGRYMYSEDMLRYFISHKAPVLETLSLCLVGNHDASEIETGIRIAFSRHVRKLVLESPLYDQVVGLVKFPSELCSCNSTLEILILEDSFLLDFPSRVGLTFLRKLHLHRVRFTDGESFRNLICGCPSLEDLSVIKTNVHAFTIAVPSLQKLTKEDHNPKGGCVINGPSLKYLSIKGFSCCEFPVIENVAKLVEEKIIDIGYEWQQEDEKEVAMYILKNAKRLKKATFFTNDIFPEKELEKLEKRREMLDELASVIRASDSCQLVFETIVDIQYMTF